MTRTEPARAYGARIDLESIGESQIRQPGGEGANSRRHVCGLPFELDGVERHILWACDRLAVWSMGRICACFLKGHICGGGVHCHNLAASSLASGFPDPGALLEVSAIGCRQSRGRRPPLQGCHGRLALGGVEAELHLLLCLPRMALKPLSHPLLRPSHGLEELHHDLLAMAAVARLLLPRLVPSC